MTVVTKGLSRFKVIKCGVVPTDSGWSWSALVDRRSCRERIAPIDDLESLTEAECDMFNCFVANMMPEEEIILCDNPPDTFTPRCSTAFNTNFA